MYFSFTYFITNFHDHAAFEEQSGERKQFAITRNPLATPTQLKNREQLRHTVSDLRALSLYNTSHQNTSLPALSFCSAKALDHAERATQGNGWTDLREQALLKLGLQFYYSKRRPNNVN